jgi:hypothetical protein
MRRERFEDGVYDEVRREELRAMVWEHEGTDCK